MRKKRNAVKDRVVSRGGVDKKAPAKGAKAKAPRVTARMVLVAKERFRKRIAASALSYATGNLFPAAKAPPGVLPQGSAELAFDENLSGFSAWGANSYMASAVLEGQAFLGYPFLSELLLRGEYRRMCETISTHMTRKWIKLTHVGAKNAVGQTDSDSTQQQANDDKLKRIEDEMKRLDVKSHIEKAVFHEEGFGRGHIYLDTGDKGQELETDIGSGRDKTSEGKVTPDHRLLRLKSVEPVWTYPANYNASDPLDQSWYKPEQWYVMAKQIHASRLLTFIGREVPDMLKPAYSFGGLPLVQIARPYVDNWLRTRQSISDLINSFSQFVLKTQTGNSLQPGGNDELFNRVDIFNVFRNNASMMVVDKDAEDFDNIAVPLGTLDALQAQVQEHMAAICAIPIVFLLGITPQGLNASSEGEIRVFYDWINAYQEHLIRPNLTRIINFIQLSLFGAVDEGISFEFEPLWSMTEKERAELKKAEAEADGTDIDKGVISPEERRQRIISDPHSPYSGLKAEDVPDLLEEESEGLVPKGGAKVTEEETGGEEGQRKEAA